MSVKEVKEKILRKGKDHHAEDSGVAEKWGKKRTLSLGV